MRLWGLEQVYGYWPGGRKIYIFLRDLGLEVSEGQPLTDTVLMQGFLCGVLSAIIYGECLGGGSLEVG